MKEIVVPSLTNIPEDFNITDFLERQVTNRPSAAIFARQDSPGNWTDVSAKEFQSDVKKLARGLAAAGVKPGDSVGLMGPTSYEWTLVDLAIFYAGGVTIPVYDTSSPSQVAWILEDSEVKYFVAATRDHTRIVQHAVRQEKLEPLQGLWAIEDGGLEEIRELSAEGPDEDEMESRRTSRKMSDIATIIYTSGTTGKPKGCELTHSNFVTLSEELLATQLSTIVRPGESTVMFIPLAHVFARFVQMLALGAGAKLAHTPQIANLVDDLQSFKPTFLLAVPRVFEKVYNAAKLKAEESGRSKIFQKGVDTAIAYSKAQQDGKVGLGLKLKHALFSRLLYGKIKAAMGGELRYAVSGGGPLGARLGHFFTGIGVTLLEGYGLTETTAPLTVNRPGENRIGSVGLPAPGNAVRIGEDGEIMGRGNAVMKGYHNLEELTAKEFDGEWFKTGDIGHLDEDGYLYITGRKKEIIVTAGGKNVAPAQAEDQIRADSLISQCMVVGDNKPFVAALITLDMDVAPDWLRAQKIEDADLDTLHEHPKVIAHVQSVIDKANQNVSRAESIREFRIVDSDFTVEGGQMTPSLKIKRDVIVKDYQHLIDDIYGRAES